MEMMDEPKDGKVFLASLASRPVEGVVERVANSQGITLMPSLKFELENEQDKWLYTFELTRAFRSKAEVLQAHGYPISLAAWRYQSAR